MDTSLPNCDLHRPHPIPFTIARATSLLICWLKNIPMASIMIDYPWKSDIGKMFNGYWAVSNATGILSCLKKKILLLLIISGSLSWKQGSTMWPRGSQQVCELVILGGVQRLPWLRHSGYVYTAIKIPTALSLRGPVKWLTFMGLWS